VIVGKASVRRSNWSAKGLNGAVTAWPEPKSMAG
jgi:hypothetical protein